MLPENMLKSPRKDRWTDFNQTIWIREYLWIRIPISGHLGKKKTPKSFSKDIDCLEDLVWYWHLNCRFLLGVDHWPKINASCWLASGYLARLSEQKEEDQRREQQLSEDRPVLGSDSGPSPELQDRTWWLKGMTSCSRAAVQPDWESGRDQGMGPGWSCKASEYDWADFSDGATAKLLTLEQSEMVCSPLGGGVCEPGTTEIEPVAKNLFGTKVWSPSLWGVGRRKCHLKLIQEVLLREKGQSLVNRCWLLCCSWESSQNSLLTV